MLAAIQGEDYMENSLTEEETIDKLSDMHKEMTEVYDYAQGKCNGMEEYKDSY